MDEVLLEVLADPSSDDGNLGRNWSIWDNFGESAACGPCDPLSGLLDGLDLSDVQSNRLWP